VKLVHLVGFSTRKLATMHGHMKVKVTNTSTVIPRLTSDPAKEFFG